MSSSQAVGNFHANRFRYRIATSGVTNIATANANSVVMPILSGGVTPNGGGYIIRQITVTCQNSVNHALANVQITTSSDGNTSNSVTSNVVLSTLSGLNTWQDMTLATAANSTIYNASVLYANVITAVANSNVIFTVWGEVVTF